MADLNKSNPSVIQQDDEAADLLMLFSNQSKKITKETEIKSKSPLLPTQSLQPMITVPNTKDSSTISSKTLNRQDSANSTTNNPIRIDNMTRSPGPASAALASGNNSNKAIVAAAALAAAAATPLPILHKSGNLQQRDKHQRQQQNLTVKSEKLDSPINLKSENIITPIIARSVLNRDGAILQESFDRQKNTTKPLKAENVSKAGYEQDSKRNIDDEHKNDEHDDDDDAIIPSYAVGPDSGIISCVCGYDHDDGLTIQCDKCFRWQHLVCMGFESIVDTPDYFQCNLCNKDLHVDVARAKKLQEEYLREEKSKKRKSSTKDNNKEVKKNIGAAQFKKRKVDDNSVEVNGVNKYNTLYLPINYFVFKSAPIKSLFSQLPEILKKEKSFVKVDKSNLHKLVLPANHLNIKSGNEHSKLKFTGISKLGLYTNRVIKSNSCVSLITGEIDTKENYILDKINKYWLLGCPKPNVFFHPELPIAIDQRGLGNYTRYIRKSCKPNCEIKTILTNKNEVKLGIFSAKEIKTDQEISLPWEWDVEHPILSLLNETETFDSLTSDLKMVLINSIQSILDLTECACLNSSECIINRIKKSSAFLQRNTRKSNLSALSPTPNQKYISFEKRLNIRSETLLSEISRSNVDKENDNLINENPSISENSIENNCDNIDNNSDINFKFKPKSKNTLYNLHILPKQVALIKKYSLIKKENDGSDKAEKVEKVVDVTDVNIGIDIMPIPIEVNPRILQKSKNLKKCKELNLTNETGLDPSISENVVKNEEKPKIVKKFSLADYKKKKTG